MRDRLLASGCCVGAAVLAGRDLWQQLGIGALRQQLPQQYGTGDLVLAFCGAVVIWLCLHAATRVLRADRLEALHGAGLALALGAFAYLHWPTSPDEYGQYMSASLISGEPPSVTRDVALLLLALGAGFALPTVVALRRQAPELGAR